jgi:hypothetical protein
VISESRGQKFMKSFPKAEVVKVKALKLLTQLVYPKEVEKCLFSE